MPIIHLLARVPLHALYLLSNVLSFLLYRMIRYRRQVVRENIAAALPDRSAPEQRRIERSFYRYLADLVVEVIAASTLPRSAFMSRVTLRNPELFKTVISGRQTPVIVLAIHQGNWEWMLHAAALALDTPIHAVYKPLHSARWDAFAVAMRSRFGSSPLPMQRAFRSVLRHRNRQGAYALVADQSASRHGYRTRFLGREAIFYRGAEQMARAVDAPVVFIQCRRLARGRYEAVFHSLSIPPHEGGENTITERYIACAEQCIREQPETYLWSSRRWRRKAL
ncbi:MAG: lysophospholipid acyltransferase family protein [Chromatocurvus sp.]